MKKLLYLHGLDSYPKEEKLTILKNACDELIVPFIDYHRPDLNDFLLNIIKDTTINCIIGSSMGGLSGYILAKYLGCQALLFNPAFIRINNYSLKIPENIDNNYHYKIVFGALDEVIDYQKSLDFLSENETEDKYNYVILPTLQHQIDVETFRFEIESFVLKF